MQETHTLIATIGDTDNGVIFSGASFDSALSKYLNDGWNLEPGNIVYTGEVKSSEGYTLGQRVLVVLTRVSASIPQRVRVSKVEELIPA